MAANTPEKAIAQESVAITATVFVAAPLTEGRHLGITGKCDSFGNWRRPKGQFQLVEEIEKEYGIFRGLVPVPIDHGSPFKFVLYNLGNADEKMQFEGDGTSDNRRDELIPGGWSYFVFKPPKKSLIEKGTEAVKNLWPFGPKTKVRQRAVTFFVSIVLQRIQDEAMNWDDSLDFLADSVFKIQRIECENAKQSFSEAVDARLRNAEPVLNYDDILFTILCAVQTSADSSLLKEFLAKNAVDVSLYFHRLPLDGDRFKRSKQQFHRLLASLAVFAGPQYWWLFFRLNSNDRITKSKPAELSAALIETLKRVSEVLLCDRVVATRVLNYCSANGHSIDSLHTTLYPIKEKHADYCHLIDQILLERLNSVAINMDRKVESLNSDFVRYFNELGVNSSERKSDFTELFLKKLFNDYYPPTTIRLATQTPAYLLPAVRPIVDEIMNTKWTNVGQFKRCSEPDMKYFARLVFEDRDLDSFPAVKKQIQNLLLESAAENVKDGSLHTIPSLRLVLLALNVRGNHPPLLTRPSVIDLQKAVTVAPRRFFQNLQRAVGGRDSEEMLAPHRKGEVLKVVEAIEGHLDCVDDIVARIVNRKVPMIELSGLDPQVADYLKQVGLSDAEMQGINRDLGELRVRHSLYSDLYRQFCRLNDREILQPDEWTEYLESICQRSILTLQSALNLAEPVQRREAAWLARIANCQLFLQKIWTPTVDGCEGIPVSARDFRGLIQAAAERWRRLSTTTAEGTMACNEMESNVAILADYLELAECHLNGNPVPAVREAYRDYKSLCSIRHLIGPFVAALQYFTITQRKPIEDLYAFINNNLLAAWDETTLVQVRRSGIIGALQTYLNVDPERPETKGTMEFVSSLVTDGNRSPLIDWLRNKTEQDMEAMGRILQGNLLEAYGMHNSKIIYIYIQKSKMKYFEVSCTSLDAVVELSVAGDIISFMHLYHLIITYFTILN